MTVLDSKRDRDVKLTAALWAYQPTVKVTTHVILFSLDYGIKAPLPIEFKVESLRIAIKYRLTNMHSLQNRLMNLEELDERK